MPPWVVINELCARLTEPDRVGERLALFGSKALGEFRSFRRCCRDMRRYAHVDAAGAGLGRTTRRSAAPWISNTHARIGPRLSF